VAIDKEQRKKNKRKQKQQQKKRANERQRMAASATDDYMEAGWLFDQKRFEEALRLCRKCLKKRPTDGKAFDLAMRCATRLKNTDMCYTLMRNAWPHNLIDDKHNLAYLANTAFLRGDFELGDQVLAELEDPSRRYTGTLPRAMLNELVKLQAQYRLRAMPTAPPKAARTSAAPVPPKTPPAPAPAPVQPSAPAVASAAPVVPPPPEPRLELDVRFEVDPKPLLAAVAAAGYTPRGALDLALCAYQVSFQSSYDQLLCLATLNAVQSLWYQEETARKVMRQFRGRAILADEVGLGKTIEAGLVLKEYLVRGLAKSVLILTPSSLVNQWQGELKDKFNLTFDSTNDEVFRQDPEAFWRRPMLLASLQTARSRRHFDQVSSCFHDLVIVDEAHHLKNHATQNWKLVNALQKTFLLLLTATPVQNNLEELYNLVTLLKPGHLQTRKAFKAQYMARGNPTDPRNREQLRGLLREVMVRNTRSAARVRLPPRFATTVRVRPSAEEQRFYELLADFVRDRSSCSRGPLSKPRLKKLLEAAGSSQQAAVSMLEHLADRAAADRDRDGDGAAATRLREAGRGLGQSGKLRQVLDLIQSSRERFLVFVNYIGTLEFLRRSFQEHGISHAVFRGGMSNEQKQEAVDHFRDHCQVLLATGIGGEGHNLQFCHTLINYDLPWNPMEIEQRIGRIHRIGQDQPVQVYNFCAGGSIEDRILDILDRKINMFELVIGEIDMILGRLTTEKEFSDLVFELWLEHTDEAQQAKAFDALGTQLKRARTAYEKSKDLDEKLFQDDFGT